jgi:hypothetical protein
LEREQLEVERLQALAESRRKEGEEKRRALKGELAALNADLELAASKNAQAKARTAATTKSKAVDRTEDVLRKQRLEEKRIRQEGEREVAKAQSKTRSLEERLREMEAAIAAEKRASKAVLSVEEEEAAGAATSESNDD